MRSQDLVGLDILVGLTYFDAEKRVLRQEQFHGVIDQADGSPIWIRPSDGSERRWLPMDRWAIRPAPGGTYRLASTGRIVCDPTLLSSWMLTVASDADGEEYYEVEPNFSPLTQSRVPKEWELDYDIKPDRIRRAIEMFGDEYIGRTLLLGVTYTGPDGKVRRQEQLTGTIMMVDYDEGIVIGCEPDGRNFTLPGDPAWVEKAAQGEYRLRSTGQIVKDPDYLASLSIKQPE